MTRVLLAYSGDLATSAAIPWLAADGTSTVTAAIVDVGQGADFGSLRERALTLGAADVLVLDAREALVREALLPTACAGAVDGIVQGAGRPLCRPVMARYLVEAARALRAETIVTGPVRGGAAGAPLHQLIRALDPALRTVAAPPPELALQAVADAAALRPLKYADASSSLAVDQTLCGRRAVWPASKQGASAPAGAFALTRSPEAAPREPARVAITFEEGIPVALNGVPLAPVELIEALHTIAGAHAAGRTPARRATSDAAAWEVCESPAAAVLQVACAGLRLSLPRSDRADVARLGPDVLRMIQDGAWFSTAGRDLVAALRRVQQEMSGTVVVQLSQGDCCVDSPRAFAAAS